MMAKEKLSSRERVMLAINHEEADRVPLIFRMLLPFEKLWKSEFEKAVWLEEHGADYRLTFDLEWSFDPCVTSHYYREDRVGEEYPLLVAEFDTPKGRLRTAVLKTKDYPFDQAQLVGDHNISKRVVEHLLKGPEDLEKFQYLLYDPGGADLSGFREKIRRVKELARDRFTVWGMGGCNYSEIAMALIGLEKVIMCVVDDDPMVLELFDMLDRWYLQRLKIILDQKPDTVVYRPLYETADFWSPELVRKVFLPRMREKADLAHQAGVKFHCYTVTGVMPILDVYSEAGVDLLWGCDPLPHGDADLDMMKRTIGGRVCLAGGLNPTMTVERGTREEVREAVIHAIDSCARGGGFILSTAGSIYEDSQRAYENILTVIETCREYGIYGK